MLFSLIRYSLLLSFTFFLFLLPSYVVCFRILDKKNFCKSVVRTIKWSRMPRPYHGDPTKLISTSLKSSIKLVDLCFFFVGKQECIKEKEYIDIEEANQRVGGAAQADL